MKKSNDNITDDKLFIILKNELIDGKNSLVDRYNNTKIHCYSSLNKLSNEFNNNYRKLFKLYKNGKGINEAKEYLNIGNLYINSLNTKLNQLNTGFAFFSVFLGLLSIILSIVSFVNPNIYNNILNIKDEKIENKNSSIIKNIENDTDDMSIDVLNKN